MDVEIRPVIFLPLFSHERWLNHRREWHRPVVLLSLTVLIGVCFSQQVPRGGVPLSSRIRKRLWKIYLLFLHYWWELLSVLRLWFGRRFFLSWRIHSVFKNPLFSELILLHFQEFIHFTSNFQIYWPKIYIPFSLSLFFYFFSVFSRATDTYNQSHFTRILFFCLLGPHPWHMKVPRLGV